MLQRILSDAAAAHGDKVALVTSSRTLTFAELDELSGAVAGALRSCGVGDGDRVSIYSQNRWEWVVAYHGIVRAGAVVNPINVMLTPEEVSFVLNDCGARAIITSGDKAAAIVGLREQASRLETVVSFDAPEPGTESFHAMLDSGAPLPTVAAPDPRALSTIGYTSGTTGHPKGAMQSHLAVYLNCALTATMHVRTAADTVVTALPAPHVYGNVVINGTLMAGGTVVLMERFDPAGALRLIAEHRATLFEGVPTMYAMMLAEPDLDSYDLSSLTRCTVGGQTIATSVIEAWERRCGGAPLIELWGMTELAGLGTTHALYAPNVHGSIGVALPGIEVRVASFEDAGVTMSPDEAGELMVRGPIVMLGYYGNEAATAATIEPDGWLHTGDVAVADGAGRFFVVDRRKDMIITAGYNVYPAEIERVIAGHPAVAMVAVGSQADAVKGELARAYVVVRPGAEVTEAEIIEHCRPHLAAYKLPRSVRFVADLPKTSTGKIMRRELRKLD
jgi:long-chain acyl-CoA synthetase